MARVRVLGPRERLPELIRVLQDVGTVHLSRPAGVDDETVRPVSESSRAEDEAKIRAALEDVEAVRDRLPDVADAGNAAGSTPEDEGPAEVRRRARLARRLRRRTGDLRGRRDEIERRATELDRFLSMVGRFEELLDAAGGDRGEARAWFLVLRAGEESVRVLRDALEERLGEGFDLEVGTERAEGRAAVLLARPGVRDAVEEILARAEIHEMELPPEAGGGSPREAAARMRARRAELREKIDRIDAELEALARKHGAELRTALLALRDRLARIEALRTAAETERAFVVEGWLPEDEVSALRETVAAGFGESAAVEVVATEEWRGEEAPVALSNPRIFRPFEAIVRMLPLPRYGSIDPTPFVAVFFPMFFGIILGDVVYGLLLGAVAALLHRTSEPDGTLRSVSEVAGACAAFTVLFGLVYGEFLGDLGHRWFGLEPLVFDREEALVPFLGLAVALGVVHVVLGLVLGAAASYRDEPRESVGQGLYAVMVLLVAVAILAAVRILPGAFFTPAVVALLVAFPILVVVEGVLAPLELLSALGNVLSYARIMALGTASVVMAVVANRLAGAMGSAIVGALFALIFHLVNFALGIFGPTIHGLRLHYVEFFNKFYSPGGEQYRPLRHATTGSPEHASLET